MNNCRLSGRKFLSHVSTPVQPKERAFKATRLNHHPATRGGCRHPCCELQSQSKFKHGDNDGDNVQQVPADRAPIWSLPHISFTASLPGWRHEFAFWPFYVMNSVGDPSRVDARAACTASGTPLGSHVVQGACRRWLRSHVLG